MKSFLVLSGLFIFILINTANAQRSGYVITKKNDTIYCQVKLNGILMPQYQNTADGKFHTIKPKSFNGYRLTGYPTTQVVKKIGRRHKPAFVTGLVKGRLNLYEETSYMKDEEGIWITNTNWYVSKGRDSLIEFANEDGFLMRHGKQIFHNMLADKPELATAFDGEKHLYQHGKFDIQKMMQYARHYNQSQ